MLLAADRLSGLEALGDLPCSASLCRPLLVSPHPSRCFHGYMTPSTLPARPAVGLCRAASPGPLTALTGAHHDGMWGEHLLGHTSSSWREHDRLVRKYGP